MLTQANPDYYSRGIPSFSPSPLNTGGEKLSFSGQRKGNAPTSFANINSLWNKENQGPRVLGENVRLRAVALPQSNQKASLESNFESAHFI